MRRTRPSKADPVSLRAMPRLAVIDTETTGLGAQDRVVEIAVVVLDATTLETVDEYDTLINPRRDVGPEHIHGISASMVEAAPTFEEIAGDLAARLDDHILVAHNLPFDVRMVQGEFNRLDADFAEGRGICTLRLSGSRLSTATSEHGIRLDDHHRALADARAAAELLRILRAGAPADVEAATIIGELHSSFRTLRRDAFSIDGAAVLARVVADAQARAGTFDRAYLETLDWMLDDFDLDQDERGALLLLAHHAGADAAAVADLNDRYFEAFVDASRRDGVVSDLEHATLHRLASLLDIAPARVPDPTERPGIDDLARGQRVCFTGTPVDPDGRPRARADLEAIARDLGLEPVASVTKRGCDLVVAADASSSSGKARKARDYGIPVIDVAEFLHRAGRA